MNNLLFSLAMAALGQFTGLGGGGFGGGFGGPGIGFGGGPGGPRFGGGSQGPAGPGLGISGLGLPGRGLPGLGMPGMGRSGYGYGSPGYGNPVYGVPGGIAIAPRPYGVNPGVNGDSGSTMALQLASVTAARCLEQAGQLAPGEADTLLSNQGRAHGWPDGWQQGISDSQSRRLLTRYGGCDGLLTALRQGGLGRDRFGTAQVGQAPRGGGLISEQPYGLNPSQPGNPPDSESEAFGLAPYR